VLRLVLQNLVINAADAVRDAGKERGVLRVSAEITREAERQQLHLQFKDDGVGIPAQNLERVFEKGFSTKPPETNHGIGLHWCANAINALGGRIWRRARVPGAAHRCICWCPWSRVKPCLLPELREVPMPELNQTTIRVLVVDDEPGVRDAYRQVLAESDVSQEVEGFRELRSRLFSRNAPERSRAKARAHSTTFEPVFCDQAQAAVVAVKEALARNQPFAVVFLDMRMPPGPDGV